MTAFLLLLGVAFAQERRRLPGHKGGTRSRHVSHARVNKEPLTLNRFPTQRDFLRNYGHHNNKGAASLMTKRDFMPQEFSTSMSKSMKTMTIEHKPDRKALKEQKAAYKKFAADKKRRDDAANQSRSQSPSNSDMSLIPEGLEIPELTRGKSEFCEPHQEKARGTRLTA